MGQSLSIRNNSDVPLRVEWWTKGYGFLVSAYNVPARSVVSKKKEAVWYSIKVIYTVKGTIYTKKLNHYGAERKEWTCHSDYCITGA